MSSRSISTMSRIESRESMALPILIVMAGHSRSGTASLRSAYVPATEHVARLKLIRDLQDEGFNLAGDQAPAR